MFWTFSVTIDIQLLGFRSPNHQSKVQGSQSTFQEVCRLFWQKDSDVIDITACERVRTINYYVQLYIYFSELSVSDVLSTPSLARKPSDSYFRTPGQVLSLTSNFSFVCLLNLNFTRQ